MKSTAPKFSSWGNIFVVAERTLNIFGLLGPEDHQVPPRWDSFSQGIPINQIILLYSDTRKFTNHSSPSPQTLQFHNPNSKATRS